MKLRLVRNGVEEPWLEYDDHYDFDFQETRVFPEMRKLYQGDVLILGIRLCFLMSAAQATSKHGFFLPCQSAPWIPRQDRR